MEFKTNDLILRTVTENDIKEIARMWEYPHETTIDKAYEALKYMADTHSKNRQKSICHLCLGVFQKKELNVIIGWCGLDGEAEMGKTVLFYMIDEKYRNQGYATQCAMELINYAFEEMEYDIIYGGCAKSNVESYRVMQKVGMVQNSFYENGDYIFSVVAERINRLLPKNNFEFIITSSNYIFRKPNKRIFDLALEKAGLQPDEVWYIGITMNVM